jgi:putative tryptophan/tyrosine transport system substrate-binding protein
MLFRRQIKTVVIMVLSAQLVARADERPHVLVLKSTALAAYAQAVAGFTAESKGIVQEMTLEESAEANAKRFKEVNGKPSLVFVLGPVAAVTARREFPGVPLVFAMVPYFQKYELEGQNSTGISLTSDLSIEFEAIKATWPSVRRVGVLADLRYSKQFIDDGKSRASALGLSLISIDLDTPGRTGAVLESTKGKVDAFLVISDKTVGNSAVFEQLIAHAKTEKLPVVGLGSGQVKQGASMAFVASPLLLGIQAGRLANRIIIEKVDPSSLAVASPEGVEMVVNLEAVRKVMSVEQFAASAMQFAAKRGVSLKPLSQ